MSVNDYFDLTGSLAVVTGARRGIGFAMATALADAGADIIGVSKNIDGDCEIARVVTSLGRRFEPVACDFADRQAVARVAQDLAGRAPDILINNAGTIRRQPAAEHSLEYWDEVLDVNLTAQFILTRAIAAPMLRRASGRIIFTASMLSFQGGITVPGYAASKSGVVGLTRALANEWGAGGVTVNAIAPGYIATDNTEALRADPDRSRSILDRIPAGRWGRPDDLAGAVVFLAGPGAAYVNGAVVPVDGGWLAR
jgi:2-deoxy-D-gluconate 3-dehydrogenase